MGIESKTGQFSDQGESCLAVGRGRRPCLESARGRESIVFLPASTAVEPGWPFTAQSFLAEPVAHPLAFDEFDGLLSIWWTDPEAALEDQRERVSVGRCTRPAADGRIFFHDVDGTEVTIMAKDVQLVAGFVSAVTWPDAPKVRTLAEWGRWFTRSGGAILQAWARGERAVGSVSAYFKPDPGWMPSPEVAQALGYRPGFVFPVHRRARRARSSMRWALVFVGSEVVRVGIIGEVVSSIAGLTVKLRDAATGAEEVVGGVRGYLELGDAVPLAFVETGPMDEVSVFGAHEMYPRAEHAIRCRADYGTPATARALAVDFDDARTGVVLAANPEGDLYAITFHTHAGARVHMEVMPEAQAQAAWEKIRAGLLKDLRERPFSEVVDEHNPWRAEVEDPEHAGQPVGNA